MVSGCAAERLADEGRHHAAIAQPHARAIGIEDADDLRVDAVIAMVGHRHRLREALGLVVNAARPDRIYVAPVIFLLRMDERIAVTLGGRGEEERRLLRLGQAERVVGAERADLQRRNRQLEIIDRAGGRREMKDVIHFVRQENVVGDVLLDEPVILVARRVLDVREVPGDEIVDRDDAMPFREQAVRQMRAKKTGAAGNDGDGRRTGARSHGAFYLTA